jgi:hypothetical protein
MAIKNIKLVSGRVPTVPPTQVASDRYQFLGLGQAEPNLGTASNGNVLTTNIYGARTWTNVVSLANLTAGNVLANTVTVSTGLFWANGVPFTAYGNADVTGFLNSYTGNISAGNTTVTGNFRGNIFADVITPYQTTITAFNSSSAVKLPVGDNSTRPVGVSGYFRYNTVGLAPEYYNGTAWVSVNNTVTGQSFSGDGSNTVYTLDQNASQAGVLVSINGTLQQPGVAYTVVGDQITFAEIPLTTDVIDIRFLGALVNTSQLVDDLTVSGNIISGNIVPSANVTYSLGNITNQWRSLWVSSNTIYIGNVPLTVSNGSVLVNGVASYSNTNVAAYLTTANITSTGNVSASNITATSNITARYFIGNVVSSGPTNLVGNVSTGNLTVTGNLISTGYGYFPGAFNEASTSSGVFIGNTGTAPGLTPRIAFFNGNTTQNWQIDNYFGTFRWFTPGVSRMTLDGNTNQLTVSGNVSSTNVIASGNITVTGNVSASGIGAFYAANRPAFRVVGNGGSITATANVTSSNFTVDYNQGSHLNTTTGFFTAPVAGLYQVNLITRTNSNTNGTIVQSVIQHNYSGGNQVAIMIEYGTNTSMNHTGGSTIIKMAVGDTLQMRVLVGTISFDGNDNWSVAYIG